MFEPGQTVVCINDQFDAIQKTTIPNLPKKELKYTVRDAFQVTRNGTASGIWALHLVEITNPELTHPSGLGTFEPSFAATRFTELAENTMAEEEIEKLMQSLSIEETVSI